MLTSLLAMAILPPIDVPKVSGNPLKPWGERGLPIVALAGRGDELRPFPEFGATVRLGWNDEGLVAQFTVTDPSVNLSANPSRPYEGDSVELYLGLPGEQNMVQLVVARNGKKFFDYRRDDLRANAPLEGRSSIAKTPDGYTMRVLLAWKTLGLEPHPGLVVGARVAINDGAHERSGLIWQPGDFFALPPVRLSLTAGQAPPTAVWSTASPNLLGNVVHVVAEPGLAWRKIRVDDQTAKLLADGPRSVARIALPAVPPTASAPSEATAEIEGEAPQTIALPNLPQLRARAFSQGVADQGKESPFRAGFDRTVLSGPELPRFAFADPAAAERLVGPIRIETKVYTAEGREVRSADEPGRYGAVVKVGSEFGGTTTLYRTLFRGPAPSDDEKTERDWWHALRKRLGTAIRYETYLRLPKSTSGAKPPLLVYLHGSGGGDEGAWENTKRYDGPMGYAAKHPDFPFAILALRSPGGWSPPAVKDAIDEALATGRFDPDRVVLCGFSMGAMGTWSVAYDEPDRFAAIAPVGGRRGDASRMASIKEIPAWVFNGEEDEATLASDARAAVAALKAAGGKVRYTQIPKASHVDSLRIAFAKPELYAWMARQRRSH